MEGLQSTRSSIMAVGSPHHSGGQRKSHAVMAASVESDTHKDIGTSQSDTALDQPSFRMPNLAGNKLRRTIMREQCLRNPKIPATRIIVANFSQPRRYKFTPIPEPIQSRPNSSRHALATKRRKPGLVLNADQSERSHSYSRLSSPLIKRVSSFCASSSPLLQHGLASSVSRASRKDVLCSSSIVSAQSVDRIRQKRSPVVNRVSTVYKPKISSTNMGYGVLSIPTSTQSSHATNAIQTSTHQLQSRRSLAAKPMALQCPINKHVIPTDSNVQPKSHSSSTARASTGNLYTKAVATDARGSLSYISPTLPSLESPSIATLTANKLELPAKHHDQDFVDRGDGNKAENLSIGDVIVLLDKKDPLNSDISLPTGNLQTLRSPCQIAHSILLLHDTTKEKSQHPNEGTKALSLENLQSVLVESPTVSFFTPAESVSERLDSLTIHTDKKNTVSESLMTPSRTHPHMGALVHTPSCSSKPDCADHHSKLATKTPQHQSTLRINIARLAGQSKPQISGQKSPGLFKAASRSLSTQEPAACTPISSDTESLSSATIKVTRQYIHNVWQPSNPAGSGSNGLIARLSTSESMDVVGAKPNRRGARHRHHRHHRDEHPSHDIVCITEHRKAQEECNRILDRFAKYHIPISRNAVEGGLIVPSDVYVAPPSEVDISLYRSRTQKSHPPQAPTHELDMSLRATRLLTDRSDEDLDIAKPLPRIMPCTGIGRFPSAFRKRTSKVLINIDNIVACPAVHIESNEVRRHTTPSRIDSWWTAKEYKDLKTSMRKYRVQQQADQQARYENAVHLYRPQAQFHQDTQMVASCSSKHHTYAQSKPLAIEPTQTREFSAQTQIAMQGCMQGIYWASILGRHARSGTYGGSRPRSTDVALFDTHAGLFDQGKVRHGHPNPCQLEDGSRRVNVPIPGVSFHGRVMLSNSSCVQANREWPRPLGRSATADLGTTKSY
ncbi:hypothetical protein BASA81_009514 [Batrachochytrium salamandrivorans]|nr:hypothetical protein BASA81_009514 [Batrachochytrium salamandrivorans]